MMVSLDARTGVDRARAHTGPAGDEPQSNKTWNDQFAKHDDYLLLPYLQVPGHAGSAIPIDIGIVRAP